MIFDTCFIIDLMKNDEKAVVKLNELARKGETQLITAVTIFELFTGLARSKKYHLEREKIMKFTLGQIVLPLDTESAEKAGEIDGTLIKEGKTSDAVDSMIAGIAIIKKEKLLTRNIKDFFVIKGLEIEKY